MKKLVIASIVPPLPLLVVGVIGLLLLRRRPRLGRALISLALLSIAALSLPLVASFLTRSLEDYTPLQRQSLSQAAAIVVLGAGVSERVPELGGADTVKPNGLLRARYAVYLYRQSGVPLLVSGGTPVGKRSEAEAMRELLERDFGVPVRWLETESRDTAENAVYSAVILRREGVSKIVLVTNAWHMPRAKLEFERAGIAVLPAPTGFSGSGIGLDMWLPSSGAFDQSSNACKEWLALMRAHARH